MEILLASFVFNKKIIIYHGQNNSKIKKLPKQTSKENEKYIHLFTTEKNESENNYNYEFSENLFLIPYDNNNSHYTLLLYENKKR